MSSIRCFALVDCNNFYASCEEVFNPSLKKKPLLILSNNDGCIIARSQKAKKMGVKMGEAAYLYKDLEKRGEINMLSSNFALYADMSQRVMQTLASFSPDMEIYSIDEAFFELERQADLEQIAIAMRNTVKKWTGIPVSIGIGATKTLAKLANEIAKKDKGVLVLDEPEKVLAKTPLEDIWGIGRGLAARLFKNGIYTALELTHAEDHKIQKILGVTGYRTVLELRGVSTIPLSEIEEKKKSIICSRSFRNAVLTQTHLEEAVSSFTARAAEKLRNQDSLAGFLSVYVATSPFKEPYYARSCHIQIPNPTSYTPDLISFAKEGLSRIFVENKEYKKAGVLLGDFCDIDARPLDLFSQEKTSQKKQKAMQLVDKINDRYEKDALFFAAQGIEAQWRGKPSKVSPKFTTSWHDLLKVR